MRRRVWKLNENNMRRRFEERVGELVNVGTPDLWKCFKESVLKACDEVCGKKKGRRDRGDMWWWNEKVKDAIARKTERSMHIRVMQKSDRGKQDQVQEHEVGQKSGYKSYEEWEKELEELRDHPNKVFKFIKSLKKDGKDVPGGRYVRGSDRRLGFSEKDRGNIWKNHIWRRL